MIVASFAKSSPTRGPLDSGPLASVPSADRGTTSGVLTSSKGALDGAPDVVLPYGHVQDTKDPGVHLGETQATMARGAHGLSRDSTHPRLAMVEGEEVKPQVVTSFDPMNGFKIWARALPPSPPPSTGSQPGERGQDQAGARGGAEGYAVEEKEKASQPGKR